MADTGIFFDRVWKKFRRGDSNVDSLTEFFAGMLKRSVRGAGDLKRAEFWAVRDVAFEVRPGEALGIIGANGAGKSTVLKLLTRILRPNRGHCELRGRVGSLIEISAGFHPDLSGRENVFLQGAIVGMKRREIKERFDAIVDFSGIGEFIDTPVRRYSSGMNARLGFSIAAHLNPDVLIIDEVLAVGDFAFQQRAFARVQEMVNSNVAAVLVSHQLERVSTLCKRALLLRKGRLAFDGPSADAIAAYVTDSTESGHNVDAGVAINDLQLLDGSSVQPGERVRLRLSAQVLDPEKLTEVPDIGIQLRSLQSGQMIFRTSTARMGITLPLEKRFELDVNLEMNVEPGVYSIETGYYQRRLKGPLSKGPRVSVTVGPDMSFYGRIYARPSMRLIASEQRPQAAVSVR